MTVLENFIGRLKIGEALAFNGLVIKPVFTETDFALPFLTLEEALEKSFLEITEKSEDGHVPELLVRNVGDLDVIILEGEELRGAKQNRIINTTIIIPAGAEIVVPVSCVEQGRWHYTSRKFSAGENVLYSSLRKKSHSSVTKNLRLYRVHRSDQSEIWSDIKSKAERLSVESETDAMSDIQFALATPEAEKDLFEEIQYQEKQIGFLAFINGGFAGGDIFGSSELCRKQMKKLLRGYYLDAVDEGAEFPKIDPEKILEQVTLGNLEKFESVGKGTELRFETDKIQGACKLVEENVSHLTIFPRE
jgi:hypothetical protein